MERPRGNGVKNTSFTNSTMKLLSTLLSSNYVENNTAQDGHPDPFILPTTQSVISEEPFASLSNGTAELRNSSGISSSHTASSMILSNYTHPGINYGDVSLWEGNLYVPGDGDEPGEFPLPLYIRVTAFVFLVVIFAVGTLGNTMVIIVINYSRDMKTSTNIFLVNLSIADLLVLLICTPTCILEVYYDPETWYLGEAMCKLVPLLEMTVAHTSVLTILAISFERYYAICCPLRANYVCTKTRAVSICLSAWLAAGIITSPVYFMTTYYEDRSTPHCHVGAGSFWPDLYTISSIVLFFLLPLVILIITYRLIAKNLTSDSCRLSRTYTRQNHRARQQVIVMLGTVVFTFFLCLLPFRVLTLYILLSDENPIPNMEIYYNLLYFCRIMLYTNSALNPILYNIMSSKFRNGFLNLCSRRRRKMSRLQRRGTFHTMTTTSSVSTTSNIPNNFIHAVSIPVTANEQRRRQGFALYGQCCRCQCHDYVTHVWLSDVESTHHSSSSGGGGSGSNSSSGRVRNLLHLNGVSQHYKHNCRNKDRRSGGFSRNGGSAAGASNAAHWYCRKCRENSKWESKYLLYGSSPTAALILNQRNSTLGYNNRYPATQFHTTSFRSNHPEMRSLLERCCVLSCQTCKPKDRHGFPDTSRAVDSVGSKLTIRMALNTNYYSCSFNSFSNTNTLETIL